MNSRRHIRFMPVLAALVLISIACQKKKAPQEELLPMDRVAISPVGESQTILHKTFSVATSVNYPFEIPAHAAMPHLQGSYKSFVKEVGVQSGDETANVDFLILNEDQYNDFSHGKPGEAVFSADASHDQDVNFSLPSTQDQPRKYYLIFRNSPGGVKRKLVQADFTVAF